MPDCEGSQCASTMLALSRECQRQLTGQRGECDEATGVVVEEAETTIPDAGGSPTPTRGAILGVVGPDPSYLKGNHVEL